MNEVAGIIFSNIHDRSIPELTSVRTMGAIPIGCGYRMIDFPLSSMANSGIKNISVIAHHNYESLVEHIGNGAEWGIPIDKGGIKIISPFMTAYAKSDGEKYTTRLDCLKNICNNLERIKEKYIVMSDCDCVYYVDLNEMIDYHVKRSADLTICSSAELKTDGNGRIIELDLSPSAAVDLNVNLWVFSRDFLIGIVKRAISRGHSDLVRDILGASLGNYKVYEYKYDTEILRIKSITEYFRLSMRFLKDPQLAESLCSNVRTKRKGTSPIKIGEKATVKASMIGEGAVIEGTVEDSIVFGNVRVDEGAVVRNSILFPNVRINTGARLDFVIADKNTSIGEGSVLAGCRILPYFVRIGKTV